MRSREPGVLDKRGWRDRRVALESRSWEVTGPGLTQQSSLGLYPPRCAKREQGDRLAGPSSSGAKTVVAPSGWERRRGGGRSPNPWTGCGWRKTGIREGFHVWIRALGGRCGYYQQGRSRSEKEYQDSRGEYLKFGLPAVRLVSEDLLVIKTSVMCHLKARWVVITSLATQTSKNIFWRITLYIN